jgi:hypothetical protein
MTHEELLAKVKWQEFVCLECPNSDRYISKYKTLHGKTYEVVIAKGLCEKHDSNSYLKDSL